VLGSSAGEFALCRIRFGGPISGSCLLRRTSASKPTTDCCPLPPARSRNFSSYFSTGPLLSSIRLPLADIFPVHCDTALCGVERHSPETHLGGKVVLNVVLLFEVPLVERDRIGPAFRLNIAGTICAAKFKRNEVIKLADLVLVRIDTRLVEHGDYNLPVIENVYRRAANKYSRKCVDGVTPKLYLVRR
jgi:hypothetical protein